VRNSPPPPVSFKLRNHLHINIRQFPFKENIKKKILFMAGFAEPQLSLVKKKATD
jgi:hypothetical protein